MKYTNKQQLDYIRFKFISDAKFQNKVFAKILELTDKTNLEKAMDGHYKAVNKIKPPHAPPKPTTKPINEPGPVATDDWDYFLDGK